MFVVFSLYGDLPDLEFSNLMVRTVGLSSEQAFAICVRWRAEALARLRVAEPILIHWVKGSSKDPRAREPECGALAVPADDASRVVDGWVGLLVFDVEEEGISVPLIHVCLIPGLCGESAGAAAPELGLIADQGGSAVVAPGVEGGGKPAVSARSEQQRGVEARVGDLVADELVFLVGKARVESLKLWVSGDSS